MTYLVTFCTFDQTVEGNPAWHGAFILSKYNEATQQVEVVDTWGYYGVPSTGNPNNWFSKLKKNIGLDVDVSGNHGWLMHEEVRFMDLGHGLHGYSYELTEIQFQKLQLECHNRVIAQEMAVREVLGDDGLTAASTGKVRCYPGEKHSKDIYEIEQRKAKIYGRESRLHPFDLKLSMGWTGPSFKDSHTCKTEALAILETVLSPDLLAPYRKSTFPRFVSRDMEDIILHSTGPLDTHIRSSGKKVYFRDGKNNKVKLVWTLPPQKIKALAGSNLNKLLTVDEEFCTKAKQIAGTLQKLEWMIRQAVIPEKYERYRTELLQRIVAYYQEFSIVKPEVKTPKMSGVSGFFYSLASLPRNKEQQILLKQIRQAEDLFNSLYMALDSCFKIDDNLPAESARYLPSAVGSDNQALIDGVVIEENPLEALVSYLSFEDQEKLCRIIGRTYCPPDLDFEFEFEEWEELVSSGSPATPTI